MNKIPDISGVKLNQRTYNQSGNELTITENMDKPCPDIHALLTVYTGGTPADRAIEIHNVLEGFNINGGVLMEDLPIVTIIHKDGAMADVVDMIKEQQIESCKHLVVNKVLANTKESAINPLDIKIGFDQPIAIERSYIKDFLMTLLTPLEADKPYDGIGGFVDHLITKVYELTQGDTPAIPKMFDAHYNRELYRISRSLINVTDEGEAGYTAQTIANALHVEGEIAGAGSRMRELFWRARDIAHTFAMPVLADLITTMDIAGFHYIYTNTVETGETLPQYARRQILEAIKKYPCFANPTAFNINANRIAAIDLQDVDAGRDHRQNSLFLQAARMVAMKKVNYCRSDLMLGDMDAIYDDYYTELARELEKHKKGLVIEGVDYYKYDPRLMAALELDARERRRLGINIIISTDNIADFYDETNTYTAVSDANRLFIFSEFEGDNLVAFNKMFTSNKMVMSDLANMDELGFMSYVRPYRTSLITTRYHLNRALFAKQIRAAAVV